MSSQGSWPARSAHRGLCATIAALALVAVSCRAEPGGGHSHGEAAHGGHGHDDHGHGHGDDRPALSITVWSDKTELFAEYPALVAGQSSSFLAHVTHLSGFRAVTDGVLHVSLEMEGGDKVEALAKAPLRPGIFRPRLRPEQVGACKLVVRVSGPRLIDTLEAGPCHVYPDKAGARAAHGEHVAGASDQISYLKEQQWQSDFATALVESRDLQPSIQAAGEIRPVTGQEARLTAAASGRIALARPALVLGAGVEPGQVLASIQPMFEVGADRSSLQAEVSSTEVELGAARVELERLDKLLGAKAVAARRVDAARTRVEVLEARLRAARGRLARFSASASGRGFSSANALQIRAPLAGTLVLAQAASGETVEAGQHLFTVINLDKVWLEAKVFEPDLPRVQEARSAWFFVDGHPAPFALDGDDARLVTMGRLIDPRSRTAPVIFEVDNSAGRLFIGQYARVHIATGDPVRGLALPELALLRDAGRDVAYVQVEGEAFERRALRLGVRDRGMVQVLEGLNAGERVVTKGAYQVKLAASSASIPTHGHVH